jgi:hypothetical protein
MCGEPFHRPPRALDTRAAFFNGTRPHYLLYFWELTDTYQLLAKSLQQLNNSAGTTRASSSPAVSLSRCSIKGSGGSCGTGFLVESCFDDEVPMAKKSLQDPADLQHRLYVDRERDRQH